MPFDAIHWSVYFDRRNRLDCDVDVNDYGFSYRNAISHNFFISMMNTVGCEIFHNLKKVIKAKFGGDATLSKFLG